MAAISRAAFLRLEQFTALRGQFLNHRFLEHLGQMRREVGPGGGLRLFRAPFRLQGALTPDAVRRTGSSLPAAGRMRSWAESTASGQ